MSIQSTVLSRVTRGGSEKQKPIVLLDIDQVLVDWTTAFFDAMGLDQRRVLASCPPTEWDFMKYLPGGPQQYWDKLEGLGSEFWATLPEFPWCDELIEAAQEFGETFIVTSPTRDPNCLAGKLQWLKAKFGSGFRNYVMTPNKWLAAKPHVVLIDDKPKNCDLFREHGGKAILFPSWGNANNGFLLAPMPFVHRRLEEISCTLQK